MTILRRRGAWSLMTNISDRDTALSLLRSAGQGNALNRNVDLILYSRVKIDADGNIVELSLGRQDQSSTRLRQQRLRRTRQAEGNILTDIGNDITWDLSADVEKLRHLNKLILYYCRSLPEALNDLPELKCLELHFCDGNTMVQRQQTINFSKRTNGSDEILENTGSRLSHLRTLEIHGGIWDAQSIFWMKCMTASKCNDVVPCATNESNKVEISEKTERFSQLEIVRFSFLQSDLRDAILDFLTPFGIDGGTTRNREGVKKSTRIRKLPTSALKHLTWAHSEMTDQSLELLFRTVVLPHHPNLYTLNVRGNQIRSLRFLFELCANGIYPSLSIGNTRIRSDDDDKEQFQQQQQHNDELFYHPLRTLNLGHNPVVRYKSCEVEAFELLLLHCFPLLGSLSPSWECWDARIEYLLRINRGGRVLVEGNCVPQALSTSPKPKSHIVANSNIRKEKTRIEQVELSEELRKKKIPLAVWPLVLHRAYETSPTGFLPPVHDATATYYLIRNGSALSEIFAAAAT